MLFLLDDTIKQGESNMIFKLIDVDNSGVIGRKEFEKFFDVNLSNSGLTNSVEKLRWATPIFQEINYKLMDHR